MIRERGRRWWWWWCYLAQLCKRMGHFLHSASLHRQFLKKKKFSTHKTLLIRVYEIPSRPPPFTATTTITTTTISILLRVSRNKAICGSPSPPIATKTDRYTHTHERISLSLSRSVATAANYFAYCIAWQVSLVNHNTFRQQRQQQSRWLWWWYWSTSSCKYAAQTASDISNTRNQSKFNYSSDAVVMVDYVFVFSWTDWNMPAADLGSDQNEISTKMNRFWAAFVNSRDKSKVRANLRCWLERTPT